MKESPISEPWATPSPSKQRRNQKPQVGWSRSERPGEPGVIGKVFFLLSAAERKRVFLLLVPIVVMAFLQVLGIASVMPLLGLLANPDIIHNNRWLGAVYTGLNFSSTNSFLIFLGAFALAAIAVSNGFTALTTWALDRFTWRQNYRLSKRLLDDYLHRPYVFFLSRNSSALSKNILAEVNQVVTHILVPGMQLIAQAAVAIFILGLLVVVDPLLALGAAALLGGAYLAIFTRMRHKLSRLGKERVAASRQLFQVASEAFGGIKDVKILGKEQDFIRQFSKPAQLFANHMATKHLMGVLPKYALETVAFGGILLIILYLLVMERDVAQLLPLLGLYAVAIYRLMPALQKIFQSFTQIRFHLAALDVLYRDLQYQPGEAPAAHSDRDKLAALPFARSLELKNITFRYPGSETPVLTDFSLRIAANTSVAFVGATGSGKTTTVDILLGLLRPETGALVVDETEVSDGNLARWQKNLGYVPQHIYLFDKSVARNIAFGVPEDKIDMAAVERAAKVADIHHFIQEMPEGYATVVGERGVKLSGGQRQRIGIARALYHDPQVLVLDEATSALDGVTEEHVFAAVDTLAGSKTVIMIAHRISTVRNCDTIYVLERGHIVAQGSYDELIASSPQFRAIAQVKAQPQAVEGVPI